ncbi:MAG TPA: hypothetical protein VLI94_00945 [Solirubrobacterales bacterium]|nr:hypothetical protein [Solirubrobacterales bacterium]
MTRAVPIRNLTVFLALAAAALAMTAAFASSARGANEFIAGKYPATIHGTGNVGVFKWQAFGGSVECKNTFDGTLTEASTTLKLAFTSTECKAFGFLEAIVKPEGCEFLAHSTEKVKTDEYKAHLDFVCPAGKSTKVTAGTCEVEYKEQLGMTTLRLVNDASSTEDITYDPEVTGAKYTVTKDGFVCPFNGTGERNDGEITGSESGVTMTAEGTTLWVGEKSHAAKTKHEEKTAHEAATTAHEHATTAHEAATNLQKEVENAEHAFSTSFPSAPQFTAGKYPALIYGSNAAGVLKLNTEAGSVQCANTYFGEKFAASSIQDILVFYEGCSAFGFESATVNPEGCGFRLHGQEITAKDEYNGRLTVKCSAAGESIKITAGTCKVEVKEQGVLSSVKLIDDTAAAPVENITMKPEVKSLKYTVTQDGVGCPFSGIGNKTTGELTSTANITLGAQNPGNPAEKYAYRIGEHAEYTTWHAAKTHKELTDTEALHKEPIFKAGKYPATIHGTGNVGVFAWKVFGGNTECKNTFHGSLNEPSTTLKLAFTSTECKAFGFVSATVTNEGCEFLMHGTEFVKTDEYKAHMDFICPAGKSLKIVAGNCEVQYKEQTGMTTVRLVDDTGTEDLTYDPEVTKVKYTVLKDGFVCPLEGTGEKTDGEITGSESGVTLTATGTSFRIGG